MAATTISVRRRGRAWPFVWFPAATVLLAAIAACGGAAVRMTRPGRTVPRRLRTRFGTPT